MSSKKKKKDKKNHFLPRLVVGIFMAIAVAQTVATIGAFSSPEIASAQVETTQFQAQVPIQGTENIRFGDSTRPIAEYIKAVYAYAVGAVGILATVMLMIGGLRWILAAGNPSSIGEAKDMIVAALSGMVLVLTSYLVLNQVNPALTDLSKNISKIQSIQGKVEGTGPTSNLVGCTWRNKNDEDIKKYVENNDAVCTEEKPTDDGGYICTCEYNPISQNCSWAESYCSPGTEKIDKDNNEKIKTCGSGNKEDRGFWDKKQVCCCAVMNFNNFKCQGDICATQKKHASLELQDTISCIGQNLPVNANVEISSISDSAIVSKIDSGKTKEQAFEECRTSGCSHSKNSCHYGDSDHDPMSFAVDLVGSESVIKAAAAKCQEYIKFVNPEGSHVHISTKSCKSDGNTY